MARRQWQVATLLKVEQHHLEPWKLVVAAAAAGSLVAATAAAMALILHLAGKL